MKTLIVTALAVMSLAVGVANAGPTNQTAPEQTPQQSGSQTNWMTVGGAGWG